MYFVIPSPVSTAHSTSDHTYTDSYMHGDRDAPWTEKQSSFYRRPVLAFGYCRCLHLSVCVCVNHMLVRSITHHPFKLGSPYWDHRCKRPWLRTLLFWGAIDIDIQGQIELQSQNLPPFELVHTITHHQLKLQFPNL